MVIEKKEKVIIFGATTLGEIAYLILQNDYEIVAFCDYEEKTWGAYLNNIPVISPEYLTRMEYKNHLIVIASPYYKEISRFLGKLGIRNLNIFNLNYSFDEVRSEKILCSTQEIFLTQNSDKEFLRWDVIVRYLAIEQFYGKNDFGFELYKKMQSKRIHVQYGDESLKKFINLLKSIEKNGYDDTSCIVLNESLQLVDGSHRLALSLYHEIENIPVEINKHANISYYGEKWFLENTFTDEEVQLIRQKLDELIARKKLVFTALLWSPTEKYFDSISSDIGRAFKIRKNEILEFNNINHEAFVKAVYKTDDIADWKVEKKLEYMKLNVPDKEMNKIQYIEFYVDTPAFRLKSMNSKTISTKIEQLKQGIRQKYMIHMDNYFHDIIIHIGDNEEQNKEIKNLIDGIQNLRLEQYFKQIEHLEYILTKYETDYMPKKFPESFPLGKDLDIYCKVEHFEELKKITSDFCNSLNKTFRVKEVIQETGIRYRIEFMQQLILQFDLNSQIAVTGEIKELSEVFLAGVLEDSVKYANVQTELIIRYLNYKNNPNKVHHLSYLIKNKDKLNKTILYDILGEENFTNLVSLTSH